MSREEGGIEGGREEGIGGRREVSREGGRYRGEKEDKEGGGREKRGGWKVSREAGREEGR